MQIDTSKVSAAMKGRVFANWRTSLAGVLVLGISALNAIKFDVAGHLAMTARDWATVAAGLLAAGVGALQHDAKGGEQ